MTPPSESATATTPASITLRCEACGRWNRIRADRVAHGPRCGSCAAAIALDRPLHLDDETFDRVVSQTTIPVLVDFHADWCGPCRAMAPAVDALARSLAGRTVVAKLDTDAAPLTAGRFQIRGIPTVILFRGGAEVRRQSGAMPLEALRRFAEGG